MEKILEKLKELNINYELFSHKATFSCEQARDVEIPWKRVKSLVLTNKNKTDFFMIVLLDEKKLDTKKIQKFFWEKKISFAKNEKILELIWVEIGHISPFALINNLEKNIKIVFDSGIKSKKVWFHPLRNDKTVVLNMDFVEKFLQNLWFWFYYLDL